MDGLANSPAARDKAFLIHGGDITRVQPSAGQCFGGRIRTVPILLHNVTTTD